VPALDNKKVRFESTVSPHLDAAYNLARWLTGKDHDAEDVLQEAMLRAFMYFDGYRGLDARAWLLKIVRNTCFTWLQTNRLIESTEMAVAALEDIPPYPLSPESVDDPETIALRRTEAVRLNNAIAAIPPGFREIIVLRELEGLSYKEIAAITDSPVGTVMSRLARARAALRQNLRSFHCVKGENK
jgi:RNA polymerase sigma-70 factor (ECF subfamily)